MLSNTDTNLCASDPWADYKIRGSIFPHLVVLADGPEIEASAKSKASHKAPGLRLLYVTYTGGVHNTN